MQTTNNPNTQRRFATLSLAIPFLILSACGGGGSANSGGGSPAYDGVYKGTRTQTATFSHGAVAPKTTTTNITLTVNGGSVILRDSDLSGAIDGTINGNKITIQYELTTPSCSKGMVTYKGSISGTTASGTLSGSLSCQDKVGPYTTALKGSFKARK